MPSPPRRHALRLAAALLAVLALLPGPPAAADASKDPGKEAKADPKAAAPPRSWAEQQSAQCAAAIQAAEQRHGTPPGLLDAIAKTESGRPITGMGDVRAWPWTVNADGDGYFFESKAAAVAWVTLALQRGVRFTDLGCMQVDWQMHPGAFRSLEEAFDPAANVDYAARYLKSLRDEAGGDWNVAVGLYHSHTPELAAAYRDRVAAVGAGIVTGIGGPEPLYQRALRRGTLRLAMAGGGVLVLHINRQPARIPQRRSACQVAAILGDFLARRPRNCRG